jgi:peptidoglycan hydrolase-like protein with peptidoglycan-binding domain
MQSSAGGDIPLTGVNPEVLWEAKQKAVDDADSIVREFEESQISKAPVFRKGINQVRALAQQQQFTEALKFFAELEPKINEEYAKYQKARTNGVRDLPASAGQTASPSASQSPSSPSGSPPDPNADKYKSQVLKVGSKGPAVEYLQKMLNVQGGSFKIDGAFGPATQKAVQALQSSKGLKSDGVVGPKTWAALGGGGSAAAAPAGSGGASAGGSPPATKGFIGAAVGKGCKNNPADVAAVQDALNKRGGANLPTDGQFSPAVLKAIEDFQKKLGQFKPDGIISPNRGTARALSGSAKIPPTPPQPKPIAPPNLGKATLDKGAFVWHSTRGILQTNIDELKKGVMAAYGTEHQDLLTAIDGSLGNLNKVVDKLDTRLADALDAAYKAKDDQARVPELKNAESIMQEYLKYVDGEPLIGHMDSNPFGVETSLKKVISDSLEHLSQLLPEATVATS